MDEEEEYCPCCLDWAGECECDTDGLCPGCEYCLYHCECEE
jgi:hypothetical protein